MDVETGQITGIITRTDLLKILTPSTPSPGRQNLAPRLESTLPPTRLKLLSDIARLAQSQKSSLYIVGGFVRDLLLNYPSLDFDLVVEGDAIALAKAVQKEFGGRITSHKRFGTAKWFPAEGQDFPDTLDFITARTEFYTHPTALPTVKSGSIKLDLHRRDFTINTLALRLDGRHYGELCDHWGGLNDLRQGLVRVLHSLSFVDDPTRMLRAVRYEQRYDFEIGARTRELLLEARPLINRISGDRIRHEFNRIFEEDKAAQMMERLQELGVLAAIQKDLRWNENLSVIVEAGPQALPPMGWDSGPGGALAPLWESLVYTLWLMCVPSPADTAKALKLNTDLVHAIKEACKLLGDMPKLKALPPSAITARLMRVPLLSIYAVYLTVDDSVGKDALSDYVTHWQHITANTTGHDLQKRGLPPSPRYAEILSTLRDAWLDGAVTSVEEEEDLLERLLEE